VSFKNFLIALISILIGVAYISHKEISFEAFEVINDKKFSISLEHKKYEYKKRQFHIFEGFIYSKIDQRARVNLVVDDFLKNFILNGVELFDDKKFKERHLNYKYGDFLDLDLKKGKNSFKIVSFNKSAYYSFFIKQAYSYFDFFIIFLTIFVPIFTVVFYALANFLKKKFYRNEPICNFMKFDLAIFIVLLAIVLRVFYLYDNGVYSFQHDFTAHVEYIKFFAQYFEIPPPHKALEFPQQPLYYMLAGYIYYIADSFNFNSKEILYILSSFSILLSSVAMIFAYKFLKLFTKELTNGRFILLSSLSFIAFTPSIIYLSTRINNDSLNMALAVVSLYFITKAYKSEFLENFYKALFFAVMLFFTKISSATMMLFFLILLLYIYINKLKEQKYSGAILNRLYFFGFVSFIILGVTILRVYLPVEGEFRFVESYKYPKQTLDDLSLSYFLSFNFSDLLAYAQSYVYDTQGDKVRHSFLTYQYGTMLFGEFNYSKFVDVNPFLKPLMQLVYIFATVLILGFVLFWIRFKKFTVFTKILISIWVVNLILVLKFIFAYPSICNTDFRYYTPSFLVLGVIFSMGLAEIIKYPILKKLTIFMLSTLAILEIVFIVSI